MKVDGVAAVTGAGQGIGLGVTCALAERGFEVLALVLEESMRGAVLDATSALAGTVRVEVLDVTAPGDFAFPDNLQVLVNNAGIRLTSRPAEVIPPEEWRRTFDVNFFGLVEMTQRAIPVLKARGGGVICNVSSGSLVVPIPFLAPYRASKAAISAFSETLRVELAQFAIRVVEILPGATLTAMNEDSVLRVMAGAADYPEYRRMAEIQRSINATLPEASTITDVGRYIADSIFDDGGPMRYGTDKQSQSMLEFWRRSSDEDLARRVLAGYREIIPG